MIPRAPSRRAACASLAAGALAASMARAAGAVDAMAGAALYADVLAYQALGDQHRTATAVDAAGAAWLRRRLATLGFAVTLQPFAIPMFEPDACQLVLADGALEAAPAWPVKPTPAKGVSGRLSADADGPLDDRIALVRLAYNGGGAWAAPGYGERVLGAIRRGASAVVAVTDGPTGELIALNASPSRFDWTVPVVLVAGREGERLSRAAEAGAPATVISTGRLTPDATAFNVVARRPGRGSTLVISTPRSGWFACAGERGGGLAVFLALAQALSADPGRELVFVAASGHELAEAGQRHFLQTLAPPPGEVGLWLHLGANLAVQDMRIDDGRIAPLGRPVARRGVTLTPDLAPLAARAFAGQPGYAEPKLLGPGPALGELEPIRQAGYRRVAGLVGANPLFHTRLDQAPLATTPELLEPVGRAVLDFVRAAA